MRSSKCGGGKKIRGGEGLTKIWGEDVALIGLCWVADDKY